MTLDSGVSDSKSSLPPLDSVPKPFFDPAFDLANPSTWSALVGAEDGPQEDATQVQEELSSHLDTLEAHLVHEINLRTSAFFSALSNLQDLQSESSSCLSRISDLKSSLKDVSSSQARKGLEIIDTQERLRVLRTTEGGVISVTEIDDLVNFARGLIEAGDWSAGLGCLEDAVRWWKKHGTEAQADGADHEPSLPLSTMSALSWLPDSVSQLSSTIATQLESAITSLLTAVMTRADSTSTLDKDDLRSSLLPMLGGLAQCGKLDAVEETWREVLMSSIREGSRKHLPNNSDEDALDEKARETRGSSLAEALRAMDHSQFLLNLSEMFGSLMSRLTIAEGIGATIQEIIEGL